MVQSTRARYRRIWRFFAGLTLHLIWWDLILRQPGLARFRTPYIPRWQAIAVDFRQLAIQMGGVLIKLGQFLSVRVDLLPEEVTGELVGLQDAVPPVDLPQILQRIEVDFGRPADQIFAHFSPQVLGSASLAQTHRATLLSGESVVVKVLRPNIEAIVETDLQVIGRFVRLLKFYRPVAQSVDLDRLMEEFDRVTRQELDLLAEGRHAERFAELWADSPDLCAPRIYWTYSASHILTMEDVGYIPVADLSALEAWGIDSTAVARTLARSYLEQILLHSYVHADPHSGNLFVKPLPAPGESRTGFSPQDSPVITPNRPFQLVFVDFGMSVEIVERLRQSLRSYVIGVGTQDAQRIVDSYVEGDMLTPGADVERLETLTEMLLKRFGNSLLGQMQNMDLFEYNNLILREFRDLVQRPPFQFPVELLFVFRAMALISGMTAQLDPNFDPWAETRPFVRQLTQQESRAAVQNWASDALHSAGALVQLPIQLDTFLRQVQRERLTVRLKLAGESRQEMQQLRGAVQRLTWVILAVGIFLGGILLTLGDPIGVRQPIGLWLIGGGAVIVVFALLRSR